MKINDKTEPALVGDKWEARPYQGTGKQTASVKTQLDPIVTADPKCWEYRSLRLHTSNPLLYSGLNDLGAAGWELVSVVPCLDSPGMVAAFLKRRKS